MEKETDLKQNGPVVLFNVDRKGRLADYAVCHSDRECGDYLLRQAELALGGAYVPDESVFCLAGAAGRTTAFRNCWTTISEKATSETCPRLACAASRSSMRPRGAAFRKGCGPYWKRRDGWRTIPIIRKMLEAYHAYHEKRENALPGRTLSAVRTDKGVLLFDDSAGDCNAWKVTCSTTRTGISPPNSTGWRNWMYTTSVHPINAYRTRPKGAPLCSPCKDEREFVPKKAGYLPDSLVAGLHPSAGCPMHADGEAFRRFVKTFGLNVTDEANEIAALTEIRAGGLSDPGQLEGIRPPGRIPQPV